MCPKSGHVFFDWLWGRLQLCACVCERETKWKNTCVIPISFYITNIFAYFPSKMGSVQTVCHSRLNSSLLFLLLNILHNISELKMAPILNVQSIIVHKLPTLLIKLWDKNIVKGFRPTAGQQPTHLKLVKWILFPDSFIHTQGLFSRSWFSQLLSFLCSFPLAPACLSLSKQLKVQ